jgi:hypothetical protein
MKVLYIFLVAGLNITAFENLLWFSTHGLPSAFVFINLAVGWILFIICLVGSIAAIATGQDD